MNQTIKLDTLKREGKYGEARISPLRRGERNNATLTVAVRQDRRPYDLAGMTAHLVWQAADGKLVGPVPMEATDPAAGTVRCTLPDACYSAVGTARAYIELRRGAELVDTTDEMLVKVIDCIDADGEQAEEYKPLIAEVRAATDAAVKAAKRAESGEDERENAEAGRVSAESGRASAETARADAEQARNQAESARASSEALRVSAETSRADAESLREKAFSKSMGEVDAATKTANAANTAATKAVTDARDAIAEVKATEAKLYPAAENILVGSETGTLVHVEDAFSGAALREITVEGASKQDGTPSPDNPVPIEVVENPVLHVTGRNLFDGELDNAKGYSVNPIYLSKGTYTISLFSNVDWWSNSANRRSAFVNDYYSDIFITRIDFIDTAVGKRSATTFDLKEDAVVRIYSFGAWENDAVSDVQIEKGTVATDYAPYTSQSLPITLPAEHPYLAKLPDGKTDEIVVDADGTVELVARVGIDRDVRVVGDFMQGQYYSLESNLMPFANPDDDYGGIMLCSALQSKRLTPNNEGIYRTWTGVYVSDKSGRTKEEIQAEVDKNAPLTVVGPIPETRYQLGKIEMPKAQDSIVNALTDAEVTPRTGIGYVRDVNIVVENLESAIASITQG